MIVYTIEQRWEILRQIGLQKMPVLANKIIFSDEAHFDQLSHLGHRKQGEAVTVNDIRNRTMLKEFSFTEIEDEDIGNIWFQYDGATCHIAPCF